jgi:general secretion pathway protein D
MRIRSASFLSGPLLAALLTLAVQDTPAAPPVSVALPSAAPAERGAGHTLNLKGVDIGVLIESVSEITGKSFIIDPRVEGKVTVVSSRPMNADELYETFQSVLKVHGFAAVPAAGAMVKIVPEALAAQDGGTGSRASSGPDELVTRVIEVRHVPATELVNLLRPLMPQQAQMVAHGSSNALLVTDRAGNLDRIAQLVRRIDTSSDSEVEVIPLRHASAAVVVRTLGGLEAPASAAASPGAARLLADERSNAVLLSGDRAQRLRMRTLIAHLDTPLERGDNTQVVYLRYARSADLVPILEGVAATLTGEAQQGDAARSATIQAHEETNALVLTASPAVFRELQAVIRQLDVRRAQVLVEAIIAEVTDELADEFGVQWQLTNYDGGENESGVIGGTNFPGSGGAGGIANAMGNPLSALGPGLNLGVIRGRFSLPGVDGELLQIGALVKALRGDGRANVLSSPSIVTLDHHEAEIKVVQEVPFLTGQYTNTSTTGGSNQPTNPFQTVDRKDVGLILTVTPHVNEGSSVRLDLRQEVSALAPGVQGAVDLITNKRELTTSVLVPDGGMLVLGGLTSEEVRENVRGVPGLSRIPLFGNLFKSRTSARTKRNLMIFLRPRILRDEAVEASLSNEKYNFLRGEQLKLRENRELHYREQQPVLPPLPPADVPLYLPTERGDLMRLPPPPPVEIPRD